MPYNIIIGRNEEDKKLFGDKGLIYMGKQYIKMGQVTSLSSRVFLDVARPHVILVAGKRGSGKSYSLSVIAEEMVKLPKEISKNLAILIFDTMGIFWTMRFPNTRQEKLLKAWSLEPEALDVNVFVPIGFFKKYKMKNIATHEFSIKTSELDSFDWCSIFNINPISQEGILIEKSISKVKDEKEDLSIKDILAAIEKEKADQNTKNIVFNQFDSAQRWGLFTEKGTEIKDLVSGETVAILDLSCYTNVAQNWSIKALIISLISKKLLTERIAIRKLEELSSIEGSSSEKKEMPIVWLMIDEAHEFIPREGTTPATAALVQLLREGRQPGISLILATQQPGEIHRDVITQSDIVISHRVTAKVDIDALNNIMQTYLIQDILAHMNNLPRFRGSAIILDDNSERIHPVAIHPKRSWHGGEAPSAVKIKREFELF